MTRIVSVNTIRWLDNQCLKIVAELSPRSNETKAIDVIKLFGGNLENLDFPLSWNSKNSLFKKQLTGLE